MPLRLQDDTIYVCERSIHSSLNIFTKLIEVSDSEQFLLQEIYSGYAATDNVKGIIYIKSDPEDCMERASIRNYSSDRILSLFYVKKIENKYMD